METEVGSESFRDKREEIGVDSFQFGEEISNLITLPTETDSSFTALLELPANQAVKLLHLPELQENPVKFSGDVWTSSVIEHAKLSDCVPIFPANAELIDRASKFSVFAATGNSLDMVKQEQFASESNPTSPPVMSDAIVLDNNRKSTKRKERENKVKGSLKKSKNVANESSKDSEKLPYVHVRARRGQATDSHSLAERARREKINARMKLLQELVPGCNKVSGTALVLDEIINHVQSLQRQVEFLSMRLAAVNPGIDVNLDSLLGAESGSLIDSNFPGMVMPSMWVEGQLYGNRHQYQQQLWPQFDVAHQPVWGREDNSLLSYDSSANSDHYIGPTSLPTNQLKMELRRKE